MNKFASVAAYRRMDQFIVVPLRRGAQEVEPGVLVELTAEALSAAVSAGLLAAEATSGQPFEAALGPPPSRKCVGARTFREFNRDLTRATISRHAPDDWRVVRWLPEGRGFTFGSVVATRSYGEAIEMAFEWLSTGPAHPPRSAKTRANLR